LRPHELFGFPVGALAFKAFLLALVFFFLLFQEKRILPLCIGGEP
jgi:hypothetical protein